MTAPENPPAVSEAAKRRVHDLTYQNVPATGSFTEQVQDAFARFIQQVSDAAKGVEVVLSWLDQTATISGAREDLAPFILPDPVDPLLIEAREIVARADHDPWPDSPWHREQARSIRSGLGDQNLTVRAALNGLRRGMELAQERRP